MAFINETVMESIYILKAWHLLNYHKLFYGLPSNVPVIDWDDAKTREKYEYSDHIQDILVGIDKLEEVNDA